MFLGREFEVRDDDARDRERIIVRERLDSGEAAKRGE